MTLEDSKNLCKKIEEISSNFEDSPWTGNVKLLKQDFDINSISTPNHYSKTIDEIEEVLRETRLLFLFSVLHRLCIEEGKLYYFDTPFQANIRYDAVMKKDGSFYLLDEDGHYRELFASDTFVRFIDESYWELYEEQ